MSGGPDGVSGGPDAVSGRPDGRARKWAATRSPEMACALQCAGSMADAMVEKLKRVYEHAEVRRELLWLRAQEKEDAESIESLERVDPELKARMRAFMARTRPDLIEDPRRRREAFARLWHERFESA